MTELHAQPGVEIEPSTGDWVRGWATVGAVVAAMIGGMLLAFNLLLCGCATRPPA